ncbi:hypothetical protein HTS61_21615 [Escherichia coli]|nr:hypothetical protein [Escherichia coli]
MNTTGEEEIFTGLASLNDLVRLAAAMGTEFPFDEYAEVQKLPVIDVEFSHLVGMDACQGEHSHCWIPPALMRPDNRRWK